MRNLNETSLIFTVVPKHPCIASLSKFSWLKTWIFSIQSSLNLSVNLVNCVFGVVCIIVYYNVIPFDNMLQIRVHMEGNILNINSVQ